MANNHMGSTDHAKCIVDEFHNIIKKYNQFTFAIKFQYRELDSFIHADYKDRLDIKYIKRFSETKLTLNDFIQIKRHCESKGFKTICTPFDEYSVESIVHHNYDYIKIASCSFTDWPLLEKISKYNLPIIASTAGVDFKDIKRVVTFFKNRQKNLSILHCVAEYPTKQENQQLNDIKVLKEQYQSLKIGFSSHESPDNYENVIIARSLGADILEKHIGIETDKYRLNNYSVTPHQLEKWLQSLHRTNIALGKINHHERSFSKNSLDAIHQLRRYAFAKEDIATGEKINYENINFSIPGVENQIQANELSKYTEVKAKEEIKQGSPLIKGNNIETINQHAKIYEIMEEVKGLIDKTHLKIPNEIQIEISHHYGLEKFYEVGCTIFNFINREYCKKIIVLLPKQKHPTQYHLKKEEAFNIIYGKVSITLDGKEKIYEEGDIVIVKRGVKHSFTSKDGAVIEEISSTHHKDDSYYTDENISSNQNRKTLVNYWF